MHYELRGKTVLVTAASKGLGFATASLFAAEGARVMIASRNEQSLDACVKHMQRETGNQEVAFSVADMTNRDDIEALYERTEQVFGGVDILINNAGGPPPGDFETITDAQWADAFELTLMSVVRATRRALPHMKQQQWGRVVNFASSSIKQPLEDLILSNTYRAGIVGLAKSLAIELAPYGVLVNTLGPGRIATDRVAELDMARAHRLHRPLEEIEQESRGRIPLGRYGTPDEFARMAVFLGSPANGYITGQSILVDGGLVRSL